MTLLKTSFNLILGALLIASCSSKKTSIVEDSSPVQDATEWKLMLSENMDQWRGYNQVSFPNKGWSTDGDGHLIVEKSDASEEGYGGDIITKNQYENFHLKADFMVSDTGNSGIFYRVVEQEDAIWHSAPEFQVLDDQTYIDMNTMDMNTHLTGDNYDLHAAPTRYSNPVGSWNTAEIIVNDNHVEHWLNGKMTVSYDVGSHSWKSLVAKSKFAPYDLYGISPIGHIGIQDHGHMIKYRDVKIMELPSSYNSIFNGTDLSGWVIYGTEKWFVENRELICESGPDMGYGYLGTEMKYKDFDLTLEFLQEADGNSGVFFRSSIEGTKITGWQAEVAPPGSHTGGIYESYGRGWLIQPEEGSDGSLKMGDWNNMRIMVIGDHVITWLNGNKMIDLQDEKIGDAKGQIALQIHDGGGIRVKWRNLKVKEL